MKKIFFAVALVTSLAHASEFKLKEEMQFDQDKVTLSRETGSPKKSIITLKTVFVNTSVNGACLQEGEVEKFGPHPSCPPLVTQVEKCDKKEECKTETLPNCIVSQGQDCQMKICKTWTECQNVPQTSMGSCSYKEKMCLKYSHPTQERLVSIILKFAKNATVKPNDKELFDLTLELEKDGKTPRWEILFTSSANNYVIEKKKESNLFGGGQYYYLITKE
ncbi:MAG: hypothetical protein ACOYL6_07520 [Bacteriovoracaceae bacterium]